MMKLENLFIILLLCLTSSLFSQSQWDHITPISDFSDIDFYDDKAFLTSKAGLLEIDITTGVERMITPLNSDIPGAPFTEIEILPNGHMWIATESHGLIYYDGVNYNLENYIEADELLRNVTNLSVHPGKDEIFFSCTYAEGGAIITEDCYSFNRSFYIDYDSILGANMDAFTLDTDGNLWLIHEEKIYQVQNNSVEIYAYIPDQYNVTSSNNYYIDSTGVHWIRARVSSGGSELLSYSTGNWTQYGKPHYSTIKFLEPEAGVITLSQAGRFSEIVNGVLTTYDSKELLPIEYHTDYQTVTLLGYETPDILWVTSKQSDSWMGSKVQEQIYRITPTEVTSYYKSDFLPNESPHSIGLDCDNNLYASLDDHLLQHYDDRWNYNDLTYTDFNCYIDGFLLNQDNCDFYGVGTNSSCNLLWNINDDEIMVSDTLPCNNTSLISFDADGDLYIFCDQIIRINSSGEIDYLPEIENISFISEVYVAENKDIWAAGFDLDEGDAIYKLENDKWKIWYRDELDFFIDIDNIIEDVNGNIWIIYREGFFKYDGTTWDTISIPNLNLEFRRIRDVIVDEQNNFWLASLTHGLFCWNHEELTQYDVSNSDIFSNTCEQMEIASDGTLHIRHTHGVSKFNINNKGVSSNELTPDLIKSVNHKLHPNPTRAGFTLSFPDSNDRRIELLTTQGESIASYTSTTDKFVLIEALIPTSVSGCYLVRVSDNEQVDVSRVVILR